MPATALGAFERRRDPSLSRFPQVTRWVRDGLAQHVAAARRIMAEAAWVESGWTGPMLADDNFPSSR